MSINIKNSEVVAQIRQLARLRRIDLTQAVAIAINHELERAAGQREARLRRMQAIADRVAALPLLDRRTPDEILAYDETGLPS